MWVKIVVYYGPCSKLLSEFSTFFFFLPTKATTPFPIQPGNSRWRATLWIVPPLKSNLSIYSFTCRIVLFLVFLSLLHQSSTPFWPYLPSIQCFIKKEKKDLRDIYFLISVTYLVHPNAINLYLWLIATQVAELKSLAHNPMISWNDIVI